MKCKLMGGTWGGGCSVRKWRHRPWLRQAVPVVGAGLSVQYWQRPPIAFLWRINEQERVRQPYSSSLMSKDEESGTWKE